MTKIHHPLDRRERLRLKQKKHEEKLSKEKHASEVRLYREQLKEQETQDELRTYVDVGNFSG